MRLGIVGGRLQGVEAAYLAAKAGLEVVVLDRCRDVPAVELAHEFHELDATDGSNISRELLGGCDVILPACENVETLEGLVHWSSELDVPLAFDMEAYRTTASKNASNRLFDSLAILRPASWPACDYPVIVKPDAESGSHGVTLARDDLELEEALAALRRQGKDPVVQQFVSGDCLSVEVLGFHGRALPFQVTQLEFDATYDCKRVVAPAELEPVVQHALRDAGRMLAGELDLNGIMDVEVMVDQSGLAVIEIDARLPSQTPSVVFHSTGVNLVEQLVEATVGRAPQEWQPDGSRRGVVYQHFAVEGTVGAIVGEARLGAGRPLRLVSGFFGCQEALTDYFPGSRSWVATLITTGRDATQAREAGIHCLRAIARHCEVDRIIDDGPSPLAHTEKIRRSTRTDGV